MQSASSSLLNTIKTSSAISGAVRLVAEWNLNRYVDSYNVYNGVLTGSATITVLSPDINGLGTAQIHTSASNAFAVNDQVRFGDVVTTIGLLPNVDYYVISILSSTTMLISATLLGPSLPITNAGSSPQIYIEVDDYDGQMFPIESIALPDRPTRGICKARSSFGARASSPMGPTGTTVTEYADLVNGARYITADRASKYKYWTSPAESSGSGYVTSPSSIANVTPTLVYDELMWCNKVRVAFESSYAHPTAYTIQITTDGVTWTTVSTTPTISDTGRVDIYRQADGSWSSAVYRTNPVKLLGVRLSVTQMDKSQVFCDIIEVSLRLESDISTSVIDYKINNTMSDTSFISPLGKASANTGSITLTNVDGLFNTSNSSSIYYGLLDKNVEFRLDQGINIGTFTAPVYEWTRLATMKTDTWNGQALDVTTVAMADDALRLTAIKPNQLFYQNMTCGEVIWRILDSIGFNNYHYELRSDDPSTLVPYFWTDGTKTVWEVFNELTQATQTALFFDEYNELQIRTRSAAMDPTRPIDWTFDYTKNGTKLPDIVDLTKTYNYEANTITVEYVLTTITPDQNGNPVMESVWTPGGDLVLRAEALAQSITSTDDALRLTSTMTADWPFTGIVQIEGEFIRYISKGYSYYNASGVMTNGYVTSQDQVVALNNLNPTMMSNFFNGWLYCGIENRGIFGTVPKDHTIGLSRYTPRLRYLNGTEFAWGGGMSLSNGAMRLQSNTIPGDPAYTTWYIADQGSVLDAAPVYYGTRVKISSEAGLCCSAGLSFGTSTNNCGYFVELTETAHTGARITTNEVRFYSRQVDGTFIRIGPDGGSGVVMNILPDVYYDIDVAISDPSGGNLGVSVYVNGQLQFVATVPPGQKPYSGPLTGQYGPYVRGSTVAYFEYLYGSTYTTNDLLNDGGFYDRVAGGYQSSQLMKQWIYSTHTAYIMVKGHNVAYTQRYNQLFVDDFSPIAHEVREFDVKYTKVPVLHSRLYLSNETQLICPTFNSGPFGAKFVIGNIARVNAIADGSDTLMFGINSSVTQQTLIYGRTVTQAAASKYIIDDQLGLSSKGIRGVNRRGEMSLTVSSPWLQTLAAATAVGDWIQSNWGTGQDEMTLVSFGNPLIQLGDLVAVNYATLDMSWVTHQFFVVGVENAYAAGLGTTLTLRRANI